MMTKDLLISGNRRDLGGFSVARILPNMKRRHVGPFVFLDHLGPMTIDDHHVLDVRPHPHIGLSTVTFLFEGRGFHRDSLGSVQVIEPGDLNIMTAGRGIVHSERTPQEDRVSDGSKKIHGVQIWLALPVDQEDCEPQFIHYPKENLPKFEISQNLMGHLLMGSFNGKTAPVHAFSRTLFMEIVSKNTGEEVLNFPEQELGVLLINGSGSVNGQVLKENELVIVANPQETKISFSKDTRFIIIGGDSFPEARYIWWNFVSSRKERIRQAAEDWMLKRMGTVPGETEFIPLPNDPLP